MLTSSAHPGMVSDTEPVGLFTEGATGIATIALAIIALAGVSAGALAAIATIVIGVGLVVQGFNTAADASRWPNAVVADFGGQVMVDCLAGIAGIVLGILALIGVNPLPLMGAALIAFGGSLVLSGALSVGGRTVEMGNGSSATGAAEALLGIAAAVLGILTLTLSTVSGILLLVGFIVVGAALLVVSATFGGAVMHVFANNPQPAE